MDMRLIQDQMGHCDIKTTALYAHTTKVARDHTGKRIEELLELALIASKLFHATMKELTVAKRLWQTFPKSLPSS